MLSYEHRRQALLTRPQFYMRFAGNAALAAVVVGASLLIGAAGYHHFAGLPWVDSVLNASMILTGMGPVDLMLTEEAKLFASGYALFSGVIFLTTATLIIAPLLHRLLHTFHLESK